MWPVGWHTHEVGPASEFILPTRTELSKSSLWMARQQIVQALQATQSLSQLPDLPW